MSGLNSYSGTRPTFLPHTRVQKRHKTRLYCTSTVWAKTLRWLPSRCARLWGRAVRLDCVSGGWMLTRNAKSPLCISSRQTPPDPAWHDACLRIGGRSPVTDGRWVQRQVVENLAQQPRRNRSSGKQQEQRIFVHPNLTLTNLLLQRGVTGAKDRTRQKNQKHPRSGCCNKHYQDFSRTNHHFKVNPDRLASSGSSPTARVSQYGDTSDGKA